MIKNLSCILLFFSQIIFAQDAHFSQFGSAKAITNPSLMHNQLNDYEVHFQRRSQWSSVSNPFNTFLLSFNAKKIYKNTSVGATLLNDEAGDSYFSTDGISLLLSRSLNLLDNTFDIGMQTSIIHRSFNSDNLIFIDYEPIELQKYSFFDLGFGISTNKIINNNSSLLIGLSAYHLNKPRQSFYSNNKVFLLPKYILHATYYERINSKITILPTLYYSTNNSDKEIIIGSGVIYDFQDNMKLNSGFFARINDAIFVTLGIQKDNFKAVVSYDINTSSLVNASNSQGGFEIALTYGWDITKEIIKDNLLFCPKYL